METKLFTSETSYKLDDICKSRGLSFSELMENAGKKSSEVIHEVIIPDLKNFNGKILVLCGPGNNGGDGMVVAKYLEYQGYDVDVSFPLGKVNQLSKVVLQKFKNLNKDFKKFNHNNIRNYSLVIDAIFGVGLNRKLNKKAVSVFNKINSHSKCIVSLDIASGVDANNGCLLPVALKADYTLTFVAPKVGQYLLPGKENTGKIYVLSIGERFKEIKQATKNNAIFLNSPNLWKKNYKWPTLKDHKYKRGHTLVRSGKVSSTGASRLASISALRVGSGAVTLASDKEALIVNASNLTSVMVNVISSHDEFLLFAKNRKINSLIIGPGLGQSDTTKELVLKSINSNISLVLDADAMSSFKGSPQDLIHCLKKRRKKNNIILTPHEGEFERVFKYKNLNKIEKTQKASKETNTTILLKGNDSIVSSPKGKVSVSEKSSVFLATAGSGDILAGLCGGLLAQGMKSFEAASAAVWIHNQIGLLSGPGLIADDMEKILLKFLPKILRNLYDARN